MLFFFQSQFMIFFNYIITTYSIDHNFIIRFMQNSLDTKFLYNFSHKINLSPQLFNQYSFFYTTLYLSCHIQIIFKYIRIIFAFQIIKLKLFFINIITERKYLSFFHYCVNLYKENLVKYFITKKTKYQSLIQKSL
jgi:hypothetical protein